ncbi:hypothetical protein BDF22DRAFT_774452 [Syncephalis plumigaleata]|nr:hypothetical protein BDF22DRAFT_774452 [Syncephalis plumigaleata]
MASSPQACQACYVQEDGYFCKSNGTDGCIIADSGIKYVNGQLANDGETCQHCPVPNSIELRSLHKNKLSNIVQDQGWYTYGNCRFGFCSLDARNNQFACPDDTLSTFFVGHLVRQKKDFQVQQQQFTEQASQAGNHGALVNPIKRHRHKMLARYACG